MDKLRPAVHCQTVRYAGRIRSGRGFSLVELKAAGLNKSYARSIGISVDHRRKNTSQESIDRNVERLNEYLSRVIIFPRPGKGRKAMDAPQEEIDAIDASASVMKHPMAVYNVKVEEEPRAITDEDRAHSAYKTLRINRKNVRLVGHRKKRKEYKKMMAASKKK